MNRSEQLDQLFTALAKAQAEMKSASLSANNPFFKSKYAPFEAIVDASRPALSANGLSVSQIVDNDANGNPVLCTILGHASGQYLTSKMNINPAKSDVQGIGSYITYLKRYCYAALVGVITGEGDDDGEADRIARNTTTPSIKNIDPNDAEKLRSLLTGMPDLERQILSSFKVAALEYLPKDAFLRVYDRIKSIKREETDRNA